LKRYILAHRCDACDAAQGRCHHKVKAATKAKNKTKSTSKTVAQAATAIAPAVESQNPPIEHLDLGFSTITDAINPTVTINEFLARLFQHASKNPSDYPEIAQMRKVSDTTKDPAESITILPLRAFSGNDTTIGEGTTTTIANTATPLFSPPGTDLHIDWGDAFSLGCLFDPNWYFLLVMDKGTEYFVSFPNKTRASPLALLKQFVTLTGRKIRYLEIDGAKESQCDKIKEFCGENDVVLQLLVTYNHTVQARVESAIGCIKEHS